MNTIERLKIANLLNHYQKKDQQADEFFIYNAAETIINSRKTKNEVEDIIITDKKSEDGHLGSYNPSSKVVSVSLLSPDEYDMLNIFKNKSLLAYNLVVLQILMHEMEHVDQHIICTDPKNTSLKKELLMLCFKAKYFMKENGVDLYKSLDNKSLSKEEQYKIYKTIEFYEKKYPELLKKNYIMLPSERMAELDSLSKIDQLLKSVNGKYQQSEQRTIRRWLAAEKVYAYQKNNFLTFPTHELQEALLTMYQSKDLLDSYEKLYDELSEKYPLEERLYYGLRISPDEGNQVYQRTIKRK